MNSSPSVSKARMSKSRRGHDVGGIATRRLHAIDQQPVDGVEVTEGGQAM